jgi:hypothetical protein
LLLNERSSKLNFFELDLDRSVLFFRFGKPRMAFTLHFVEDNMRLHKTRLALFLLLSLNGLDLFLLRKLILLIRTGEALRRSFIMRGCEFFSAQEENDLLVGMSLSFDSEPESTGLTHKLLITAAKGVLNERREERWLVLRR